MNDVLIPDFGAELSALLPYLVVAVGALLVLLQDAFVRTMKKDHLSYLTLFILIGTVVVQVTGKMPDGTVLSGMLAINGYTLFFNYLFCGIAVMTTIFATGLFDRQGSYRPEFYPLILLATLGMMVLVAANDLLALYLGLETMSLSTYVLAGGVRGNIRSSEAGFKYLIMGGFSSAFLLMGMALVYGFSGGTGFADIAAALKAGHPDLALLSLGSGLMLVGFGFKIALVPFHMWTPDVYEGAPAYVTGFMATGIKAAGFGALIRVAILFQPQLGSLWFPLLSVLAVLTMSVGNLAALVQSNIKRMLAWSSVAHAGYLMLGVLTFLSPSSGGTDLVMRTRELGGASGSALLFYLIGYSLMNLAAFGIVNVLGNKSGEEGEQIGRYAGLGRTRPLAAVTLTVALFSLAGIPPLVGFMAKFYIFQALVQAGLIKLAIFGVINSLISVYYYLRVTVLMYMHEPEADYSYQGTEWVSVVTSSVLALLVIYLGVQPGAFHRAAEVIFRNMTF